MSTSSNVTWRGKPLENYNRDELLAICCQLITENLARQQRALGIKPAWTLEKAKASLPSFYESTVRRDPDAFRSSLD